MSDAVNTPHAGSVSVCLNMIVRNEAHIVHEVLDAVSPYISSWVIVDTGSDDGTQDVIRNRMSHLGIPGELHERPWVNFAHNRTEALHLAQGHGDYIWVMDADDTVVGKPDFAGLNADIYTMRIGESDDGCFLDYRRPILFRSGTHVRYEGVIHEFATWTDSYAVAHLDGDYYVECRHLGARSLDPQRFEHDRDTLLAEIDRNPGDARSVFYLAQTFFLLRDFRNARTWYERRIDMNGYEEEVHYSKIRIGQTMAELAEPWPNVQEAYLAAWTSRPIRSEPLYFIARAYRESQRYELGYAFAKRAAEIPLPVEPVIQVRADIYSWRALDEQAVCASWTNRVAESFGLTRQLLANNDIQDSDRKRMALNRDICVPTMMASARSYPAAAVDQLASGGDRGATVTVTVTVTVTMAAGADASGTELTLNSFLNCCLDVAPVGRVKLCHHGLTSAEQARLQELYPFLDLLEVPPDADIRDHVDTRFWLRLAAGWQFFAPENLITRLTAILEAEPDVYQVGINYTDATHLTGTCAHNNAIRHTPDTGRYTLTDTPAHGPAMFDTTRLSPTGLPQSGLPQPGLRTATLDEVLCTVLT